MVLHNLFYALAELASDFVGLVQFLGLLEVLFFLVAVVICPPGALVGAVGAAVMAISPRQAQTGPGWDVLVARRTRLPKSRTLRLRSGQACGASETSEVYDYGYDRVGVAHDSRDQRNPQKNGG